MNPYSFLVPYRGFAPLPATLDGEIPVLVTAVLQRTAVYELDGEKHLARLDRFEGLPPEFASGINEEEWFLPRAFNSRKRGLTRSKESRRSHAPVP